MSQPVQINANEVIAQLNRICELEQSIPLTQSFSSSVNYVIVTNALEQLHKFGVKNYIEFLRMGAVANKRAEIFFASKELDVAVKALHAAAFTPTAPPSINVDSKTNED